jgi:uncharacterized protein YndB with AHSA1/START domain
VNLREKVTIARPRSVVFAWITEPDRARQWQLGVLDYQVTEPTPEVLGTRFRQTVGDQSRRVELRGEVTDFQQDEVIELAVAGRGLAIWTRYCLSDVGPSTLLDVSSDVRLGGPLSMLLAPFARGKSAKHLRTELSRLQSLCEGRQPPLGR